MADGVRVTTPQPGAVSRMLQRAVREGLRNAASAWHERMMPLHFKQGAAARYNYAPRTAAYMRRKARRKRHQRPLVWSGWSEDQAANDFTVGGTTVAGQPAGVVTMRMPSYFVQHPSGGTFIDKPAELTRTTPDEQQALAGIFARHVAEATGMAVPSESRAIVA